MRKCEFFLRKIHYLGNIILEDGISVDPEKVEAIMNWLVTHNVSDVRYFMGLTNYYRIFIVGFSKIVHPITSLQRKNVKFE